MNKNRKPLSVFLNALIALFFMVCVALLLYPYISNHIISVQACNAVALFVPADDAVVVLLCRNVVAVGNIRYPHRDSRKAVLRFCRNNRPTYVSTDCVNSQCILTAAIHNGCKIVSHNITPHRYFPCFIITESRAVVHNRRGKNFLYRGISYVI